MTPTRPLRRMLALLFVAAAVAMPSVPADAHFLMNGRNRIIVVGEDADGLRLWLRIPAPLAYARQLAARQSPTDRVEAPFIVARDLPGGTAHHLDVAAIRADPDGFGRFVADGYRVVVDGFSPAPVILDVGVRGLADPPPFATPGDALAALAGAPGDGMPDRPFVGETMIEVALLYPGVDAGGAVRIASTLPPLDLPPDIFIDNHFVDVRGGGTLVTAVPGQMAEPVRLDSSALHAASTFVVQGILHIIEGPDHVLFVLCLTLGAASFGRLLWQVTGFTIGHSVTLIAGFLGYAPSAPWFIPAVEAAIALSIVYAGVVAMTRLSSRRAILVTTLIGLLHGFGFAFVLGDILGRQAPNLLVSLVSFNLGVEIGQVAIVAAAALALAGARALHAAFGRACRVAVAAASIAIAFLWAVERVDLLVAALGRA